MNKVDKTILYELYVIRGEPMHEIAKQLDIAVGSVYNYIHKYGIEPRTRKESITLLKNKGWEYPTEAKEKISKAKKGKNILTKQGKKCLNLQRMVA